jgi:hypothetical protein
MSYRAGQFVGKSYKESDALAKSIFKDFIVSKGHTIISDEEDFYHDLETDKNGSKFLFELEFKSGYPFTDLESFQFDTVSFLGRKKRLHEREEFFYVILCKETGWALMCHSSKIFKDEYIEDVFVNTNQRFGEDLMYRVPKDLCTFFNTSTK